MAVGDRMTGKEMQKLLTVEAAELISELPSPISFQIAELMLKLRDMHIFARSDFMGEDEIQRFKNMANEFSHDYEALRQQHFPLERFSPSFHLMLAHAPNFSQRWKYWGLFSDQCVENIHYQQNRLAQFYKRFSPDDCLLKLAKLQTAVVMIEKN